MSGGKARQVRTERFTVKSLSSFGEDADGELYVTALDGMISKVVATRR
jgi:hypothetical protein